MTKPNDTSPEESRKKGVKRPVAYRSVVFDRTVPIPENLLTNLRYEYLRRELWVPLE
jgi:hypothetical protein